MTGLVDLGYLREHGITTLEDLVGHSVFFVYPSQGIKEETVRKIEFGKKREWFFNCGSINRLSELGDTIFLDYDEAHAYQLLKLEEYSQRQRERILCRERETREKELLELDRLLKKYPDEESRKLPVKDCSTCANNIEFPPAHTCDICTSLDQEEYSMWKQKENNTMSEFNYLKEKLRYLKNIGQDASCNGDLDCDDCKCMFFEQMRKHGYHECHVYELSHPEEAMEMMKRWSKEHPRITNADKFKEVFGEDLLFKDNKCSLYINHASERPCGNCNWWNKEYVKPSK